jgi:hypothetical protein
LLLLSASKLEPDIGRPDGLDGNKFSRKIYLLVILFFTLLLLSASKLEPDSGRPDGLDGNKLSRN